MPERASQVSVERGLRWVQQFAEREWPLLLPIAFAFFGLPRIVALQLMGRRMAAMSQGLQTMQALQAFSTNLPPWWMPLLLAILLAALLGALSLMALALRPRISVGEAILFALRRLPVCLALVVMVALAMFVALVLAMTIVTLAGGGPMIAVAIVFFGMIVSALLLLLALPIILVERVGPIGALREAWQLYRGHLLRITGGLVLFGVGAWVVVLAAQVSIGSLLMVAAGAIGQKSLGEPLSAIVSSAVASIGWAGFYLLIAAFYRQRVEIA